MLLPGLPSLADYRGGVRGQGEEQTGPPVSTAAPFVSGSAVTGQTVSCNGGSWSGARPLTLTYQWTRDASDITGETTSTYLLDAADEGADIACVVTATNGEGSDSANSNTIVPSPGVLPLESDTVLESDTILYSEGAAV